MNKHGIGSAQFYTWFAALLLVEICGLLYLIYVANNVLFFGFCTATDNCSHFAFFPSYQCKILTDEKTVTWVLQMTSTCLGKNSFQCNKKFAWNIRTVPILHNCDFSKSNNGKIKTVTKSNQSTIKTTDQSENKNGKLSTLKPKTYCQREALAAP